MGLIRKTLMVGTLGVVSGSSKKQKVARRSMRELQHQTVIMQQQAYREQVAYAPPAPVLPPPGYYPLNGVQTWWDGAAWRRSAAPCTSCGGINPWNCYLCKGR